jgi:5-(hydroxymethyl)furfural/furfural oxidase
MTSDDLPELNCDYLIVGGGSAGCVLANRLSARSAHQVVLIEAGADLEPGREPADITDIYPTSYYNKAYMWPDLVVHWRRRGLSPAVPMDQGRIMGGSGSVMGMLASRGMPQDYDEWESLGAQGWNWDSVLPFFRRLETDRDFRGELHGGAGPIPIRRTPRAAWPALTRAVAEAAAARQLPYIADMNGDFREGLCSQAMSSSDTRRGSSALGYLDAPTRRRPNLRILSVTRMDELIWDAGHVIGVVCRTAGRTGRILAREVILSAGALQTPQLMMRSGIGDPDELKNLAIPVRAAASGVGRNLQNHPALFVGVRLKRGFRHPAALRPHATASIRTSSGVGGARCDIYIGVQSKSSWNALGTQIGVLSPVVLKPSSRGSVALERSEAGLSARIEFNFLADPDDVRRMAVAMRLAVGLIQSDAVRTISTAGFAIPSSAAIRKLNRHTALNRISAAALSTVMDGSDILAGAVTARLAGNTAGINTLLTDDALLNEHITRHVSGLFHPAGTCRMGRASDPAAVVDSACRVHGVAGLRVVDASVMPTLPRGNTNIPTIMVAEKAAAAMLDQTAA